MSLVDIEYEFNNSQPSVEIIEQPAKFQKFRYRAEERPGLINGISSTPGNRIPFSLKISGYTGCVQIVVSCVTKDEPYKPHPHNLVGQHCQRGYYFHKTKVSPENPVVSFHQMALQCVKRNEVSQELQIRETEQVDPFKTGFDHRNDLRSIDLKVVRLAIQVFLLNENRRHCGILNPIVSNPIFSNPDPKIYRLSHSTCYVDGGQNDIILLCTKINKENVRIKFYQLEDDKVIWEDYGSFHFKDVYNQSAICFKPPSYKNLNILEPVDVFIKLVILPEHAKVESPSVKFQYLPLCTMSKKRTNPLFDQLVKSTKSQQPLNVPITRPNDNLPTAGPSRMVFGTKHNNLAEEKIFQSLDIPVTKPKNNLESGGASWVTLPNSDAKRENLPASMISQVSDNFPSLAQSCLVPVVLEFSKEENSPDFNQSCMVRQNSEELPFGQPRPNEHLTDEASLPRLNTNCVLMDSIPSAQHVPVPINEINNTNSESMENAQGDTYVWNISEEIGDINLDVDSASGISNILGMDCDQIHIDYSFSSGDLNMTDAAQ